MTTQKQEIDETEQIDFIGYMDVQHHINRIGVEPVQAKCPFCVREERDRLREELREYDATKTINTERNSMSKRHGCTDGGCVFGPPEGQHTNGGCKCLWYLDEDANKRRMVRDGITALREERDRLRDFIRKHFKSHAYVEDGYYSCPKAENYFGDDDECNCGHDDAMKLLERRPE